MSPKYIIELHNSDGDLVSILENAYNISYTQTINAPHIIAFLLPANDSKKSNITLANEIWLVDYETGDVVRKFILQTQRDQRGDSLVTEIMGMDYLSQLASEKVFDYNTDNATIDTIIDSLLAMQVRTPVVTKGTITASYTSLTRSIQANGDSVLRVLLALLDTVGGYLEVDNDRQLNWYATIGEDKGQQIRYRKNLTGITREIDYTGLCNRIYAYGAGEGDAQLRLSDAEGQTEDYVEDTASQATWGGVYTSIIVDRRIKHPDTLLAWANLKLAEWSTPPITYDVNTVDLSNQSGFDFEALQLGSTITVIDEDLSINTSVTVVRIEHPDLSDPTRMMLELATRTKDIAKSLATIYDTLDLEQHVATEISAGQVIVKGDFTVQDWATEGETTINGDNIETGTITSQKLSSTLIYAGSLEIDNQGNIRSGQLSYDDGVGWYIGNHNNTAKLSIGDSTGDKITWNGSQLVITGGVILTSPLLLPQTTSTNLPTPPSTTTKSPTSNIEAGGTVQYATAIMLPGTVESVPGSSPDWEDVNNIKQQSGSASVELDNEEESDLLKATNFGFNIPPSATILGIEVKVTKKGSNLYDFGTPHGIRDVTVSLTNTDGNPAGNNKRSTAIWSTRSHTVVYGGSSDTWGRNLTADDVNSSNFGVVIQVVNTIPLAWTSYGTERAYVYSITVRVYYEVNYGEPITNPENAYSSDDEYAEIGTSDGTLYVSVSKDGVNYEDINDVTFSSNESVQICGDGDTELWGTNWTGADLDNLTVKIYNDYYAAIYSGFGFSILPTSILTGLKITLEGKYNSVDGKVYLDHIEATAYYGDYPLPVQAGALTYISDLQRVGYRDNDEWVQLLPKGSPVTTTELPALAKGKLWVGNSSNRPEESDLPPQRVEVNDTLDTSANTGRTTTTTTYTKIKEILIGKPGNYRIKFDIKAASGVNRSAYGQIYKNGMPIGTEQQNTTASYVTYSEDINDWEIGDTCELWVKSSHSGSTITVRDFRLYGSYPSYNNTVVTD